MLCAALPAPAQPAADDALREEVVVRASRLAPGSSVSAATALPSESADLLPLLAHDLLRAVPGAFVQQTTPGQGIPIVRGLKGSQVLHVVDGFRLNNALYRSAPNQYLGLVPAPAIARVTVARGPVGTLYGSDAMGGVVEISTRKPRFDQPLQWGGRAGWIGALRGTATALQARAGSSRHAFEAGVAWEDIGDRRIAGGRRIAPSAYEQRSAWLRSRHRVAGGEWEFGAQLVEQPATPRVDELLPGFGQVQPAASEFAFEPNRREFLQLRMRRPLPLPLAQELSMQLGWQRIVDDRRIREFDSPVRTLEKNASELFGFSALAQGEASRAHRWRYGVDLSTDRVRSARLGEDLRNGGREALAARFADGSRMNSLGVFADYRWLPGPRTSVQLGLRYSRFRVAIAATPLGGEAAVLTPDDVSARLGVGYRLTDTLSLRGNLAQGFRAPNVFDLSALGPRPGNRFNVAGPSLAPERITSLEAGLDLDVGAARLELTVFSSDYRDRITSVLTGEQTDDGRLVVRSENVGEARIRGAEVHGRWRGGSGVLVDGAVNWVWGEDRLAGDTRPADRIPPLNGRLRLAVPLDAWRFEAVALFAAAQDRLSDRDLSDPRINPNGTPGWLALNLRLRRDLGPRAVLSVGIDNLLDRRYREHGSGIDAPGRGLVVELALPFERR